jgi:hypothetical protein
MTRQNGTNGDECTALEDTKQSTGACTGLMLLKRKKRCCRVVARLQWLLSRRLWPRAPTAFLGSTSEPK